MEQYQHSQAYVCNFGDNLYVRLREQEHQERGKGWECTLHILQNVGKQQKIHAWISGWVVIVQVATQQTDSDQSMMGQRLVQEGIIILCLYDKEVSLWKKKSQLNLCLLIQQIYICHKAFISSQSRNSFQTGTGGRQDHLTNPSEASRKKKTEK